MHFPVELIRDETQCSELVKLLGGAVAGLHTMTDEHFGIVVVEYMAAGAVPIGKCAYFILLTIWSPKVEGP